MKKVITNWKKSAMVGLTMSIGMFLSACQTTDAGAVMAIEDEGGNDRHLVKKIIGGIVTGVRRSQEGRNVSLKIRETRIGKDGSPICDAPTGRILSVESVGGIFSADPKRLRSAMIVMEAPSDPTPRDLKVGECVSVAPDDIDRVQTAIRSSIEIAPALHASNFHDKVRKGVVELWAVVSPPNSAVSLSWSGAGQLRRTSVMPTPAHAKLVQVLRQPA
jgi:hypothetical protein